MSAFRTNVVLDGITASPLTIDARTSDAVKSAVRVLEIFEFFYRVRKPARAVEITSYLGIPKSSANGLLKTLVERGYLTLDPKTREYFLSFRLVGFGNWLSSFYFGSSRLTEMLEKLRERSAQTVALTVRNELDMQFAAVLTRPGVPSVFAEGRKWPIVGSTVGAALLMTLDDDEVFTIAWKSTRGKPRRQREYEVEEVLAVIRGFRHQGYAVTHWKPHVENTMTIALPLPPDETKLPMILSLAGMKGDIAPREKEFVSVMRACIAEYLDPRETSALSTPEI